MRYKVEKTLPKEITEGLKKPMMHVSEFPWFVKSIELAAQEGPKGIFVEIGVRKGKSFACLLQALNRTGAPQRQIHSIEPVAGSRNYWDLYRKKFGEDIPCEYYRGFSQDPDIVNKITAPIAWLYIDGCHCFECVWEDIDTWGPKVTPGGIMVFHDTRISKNYNKTDYCIRLGARRRWGVKPAIMSARGMKNFEVLFRAESGGSAPGLVAYVKKGRR